VIGANVIINTGATVDHDCSIGDGSHIAPGCHLCGGVVIGTRSLLGAGTTVIPGVRIGNNVVIGAGSTVTMNVADNARLAGSPARPIERVK
jgi:acetyltransferase-like isoleucine patch superfamily enzyme